MATAYPTLWPNELWPETCRRVWWLKLPAAVAWLVRRRREGCFFPSLPSSLTNIVSTVAEMVTEEEEEEHGCWLIGTILVDAAIVSVAFLF